MPRQRKQDRESVAKMKLAQPDRSGPSDKTLIDMVQEKGLFAEAERREALARGDKAGAKKEGEDERDEDVISPGAERVLESVLWMVSLAALHLTLDILVQNQYAVEFKWPDVITRSAVAFFVFLFLFYFLHPHDSTPVFAPRVPKKLQYPLRQMIFFSASVAAGCYLVHITNNHGYLAVMKQAPPLGCVWVWSVIELDLIYAVASIACVGGFLKIGGYSIK